MFLNDGSNHYHAQGDRAESDPARFDPYVAPHQHFYCKVCRTVFDVVSDAPLPLNINPIKRKIIDGHQIDAIQVNFKGVCRRCRGKG